MRNPRLVGAAEAAEILGVEVPRITRYKKEERMPPPAVELASTTVWYRSDVERLAKGSDRFRARPLADERGPLVLSTAEAAALLGVDKSQVGRWRRAGRFPEPFDELRAGPLWWRDAVDGFAAARGRPARVVP